MLISNNLKLQELDYLVGAISNPKRPFGAIVGGSKVSSKIGVIESLLEKCDILLLGGGMIFTFYKAQGLSVGTSLVEDDKLDLAASLLAKAKEKGISIMLPTDIIIADKFAADASTQVSSHSNQDVAELLKETSWSDSGTASVVMRLFFRLFWHLQFLMDGWDWI